MSLIPESNQCNKCGVSKEGAEPWIGVNRKDPDGGDIFLSARWERDTAVLMKYQFHFCSDRCVEQGAGKLLFRFPEQTHAEEPPAPPVLDGADRPKVFIGEPANQ